VVSLAGSPRESHYLASRLGKFVNCGLNH